MRMTSCMAAFVLMLACGSATVAGTRTYPFTAKLGAKNGVSANTYTFRATTASSTSGSYSSIMISECAKHGMKPVCEHPKYCKDDTAALYIGQSGDLAAPVKIRNFKWAQQFPGWWSSISTKWIGLCAYTASGRGNYAMCNVADKSYGWKTASESKNFMCGSVPVAFTAKLGAKNGVSANTYTFRVTTASSTSGSYSSIMIRDCAKHGMKPVCDYPGYCKNDNAGLYIGQTHYIAYAPYRNINSYFPSGWSSIKDNWSGLCGYAAKASINGNARCNQPTNSHGWRTASQFKTFMCGSVLVPSKAPTKAPTKSPTTKAPTKSPTTKAPTVHPTTQAPTEAPTMQLSVKNSENGQPATNTNGAVQAGTAAAALASAAALAVVMIL